MPQAFGKQPSPTPSTHSIVFPNRYTVSFSILRQAAQAGDVAALQAYAAAGSNLFSMHPVHRITPLSLAVDNSQLASVRFLIQAGANVLEVNTQKGLATLRCNRNRSCLTFFQAEQTPPF
jgi:ankyrin repeat protein